MRLKIITVGKLKNTFWQQAGAEYQKRLKKFTPLETLSLPASTYSDKLINIKEETAKIINKITTDDILIILEEKGKTLTSLELANKLTAWQNQSQNIVFIIGGTFGLTKEIKNKASLLLSLTSMTLTHEMAQIILLEQLYRAFTIIKNIPYHY